MNELAVGGAESTGTLDGSPIAAQVQPPGEAEVAGSAIGRQTRDDVVAGLDVGDAIAHRLHYAGRLMAEDGRHLVRVLGLHEVQVGVAQARRRHPYQHLVGPGLVHPNVGDDEFAGNGLQNCCTHVGPPKDSQWCCHSHGNRLHYFLFSDRNCHVLLLHP